MNDYVDAEHIRRFMDTGEIEALDSKISREAERHLVHAFPLRNWSTIVDWDKVPSMTLNWTQVQDDEAIAWAMNTSAGSCSWGLLLFRPDQRCLIGPFEFVFRHLDALVWKAPGCRVLFGVDRDENGKISFGNGVIEFNGKGELFATIRA